MKNFLFLFLIPFLTFSQTILQGVVVNDNTKLPLPFASITTNTNIRTLTDIDGRFSLKATNSVNAITISYVGYASTKKSIKKDTKFISVALKTSIENLNEVLITSTNNPALQIIQKTIDNKSKNNIEKALNSFKFNAYNKVLITANPDSINGNLDSIYLVNNGIKSFKKIDSTNYKFKKEINNQHLYISEKISEFIFEKGKKKKEVILASRMAGLKQPIYELFALSFQGFSFYNEIYTIAGTNYTNPVSKNAIKQYYYKILDTVNNGHGTSFIIHFKPKKKKEYLGIEGVLYIDTENYAITKAVAELKGIVSVKAVQNYAFNTEFKNWFPKDKNVIIKKGTIEDDIALFGGMVKFNENSTHDSIINTSKNKPEDVVYFISTSKNSNIQVNTPVSVKRGSSTILFNDDAAVKTSNFWNKYRANSLTNRGIKTYTYLDSISEKEGVEKKINLARNLLKGYFPTKYINLDLGKILNLNNHEGFRVGFGGITNTNFSQKFKVEAYGAYGTKDTNFKYSFGGAIRLNKDANTWFGLKYTNDIKEAASLDFIAENTSFSPINPRNLNIDKFYNYKTFSALLHHDIQPNIEAKLRFSSGKYKALFNYKYSSPEINVRAYKLTNAVIGINYTPRNEYMNSPLGKIKVKNGYPQFSFQLIQSLKNVLDSDFGFTQVNIRANYKIERLRRATTSFLLESGIVFGETPISHLYNATPNYTYKNPWTSRITFAGKNSFETMSYNEFISDRFVALHLKHEFRIFKFNKRFKPRLTLVTRFALGDIEHAEYHQDISFNKLNKCYFESGLEFNSLFKGFGVSAFYRYGAYIKPEWSDNLAVKITYNIHLGF